MPPLHPGGPISSPGVEGPRANIEERDVSRIRAFTDGVMAVAITLLVLNIDVPDVPSTGEHQLGEELVDLLPSLGAYALSFALVGRYWVVHHRLFENLRTFDGPLMSLNLVFLALIGLVPFSTNLFDTYHDEPIAAAVFAGTLGFAALANTAMILHIQRRGFAGPHVADAREPFVGAMSISIAAVFFLSVPLAFIAVPLAQLTWLSVLLLRRPLRRLWRR
jgi:uncharacterized membrane protein